MVTMVAKERIAAFLVTQCPRHRGPALRTRCRDFDLEDFYDREWGPASELSRRVLDVEVEERQYPAYYFHATRVIPTHQPFVNGLLPLGEVNRRIR
jgi:hypothetical protein